MPYNDPDPTDPNVLVGVVLPAEADTMREMAYAFAEEFALLGYGPEALLSLFQNPFYAGAHQAYRTLGEPAIREIVAECLAAWGGIRMRVRDVSPVASPASSSAATQGDGDGDAADPVEATGGNTESAGVRKER